MSMTSVATTAPPHEQTAGGVTDAQLGAARKAWRDAESRKPVRDATAATTDSDESGLTRLSTTTTVSSSLAGASGPGPSRGLQPSLPGRTPRMASRNSMSRDFKIDDLRNEIKDLERRLKESERENKALKRIQARQERELLKTDSARRPDGADASRAHAEEVRALRALLAEGRDRLRDYEKKLHFRNCELQKMRQALVETQSQLDEKQTLLEKEAESGNRIEQLERDLQDRDTEVHELRRKLDTIQITFKKELVKERAQSKSFQKQLQTLKSDHELLQRKIKDTATQSFFQNHRDFFNHEAFYNGPRSIFTGMDQEKKERLLARLKDIDLSGTIVKSSVKRPRAARRLSVDSHPGRMRLRSTVAANGFLLNEPPPSENTAATPLTPTPGPNLTKARRISDTNRTRARGESLGSILEMQALQLRREEDDEIETADTFKEKAIRSRIGSFLSEGGQLHKSKESAATDVVADSFLVWKH